MLGQMLVKLYWCKSMVIPLKSIELVQIYTGLTEIRVLPPNYFLSGFLTVAGTQVCTNFNFMLAMNSRELKQLKGTDKRLNPG